MKNPPLSSEATPDTCHAHVSRMACVDDLAKLDVRRQSRTGIPEFILAEGKRPEDVAKLLVVMANSTGKAIATRISAECVQAIQRNHDDRFAVTIHDRARMIVVRRKHCAAPPTRGIVGLLAAGTADIPVAEEAKVTAEEMGCEVLACYDVGVAGIHRLVDPLRKMAEVDVDVIIMVAGMEGALASVVRGLVDVPVIGVPTSVGYGYGGGGQAALMAMLQSCSPGLVVVNIDNGFGAGATAALIASRAKWKG